MQHHVQINHNEGREVTFKMDLFPSLDTSALPTSLADAKGATEDESEG
jgi:hypothetical protein